MSWKVLHIFMVFVYDFGEFLSIYDFFKDPHLHNRIKSVGPLDIFAYNFCNGRSPVKQKATSGGFCI